MRTQPTKAAAPATKTAPLIAFFHSIAKRFATEKAAANVPQAGYEASPWHGQYAGHSSFADSIRF